MVAVDESIVVLVVESINVISASTVAVSPALTDTSPVVEPTVTRPPPVVPNVTAPVPPVDKDRSSSSAAGQTYST